MLVERWRMLLADESGFTLPELLTSMAILLTIMAGFTACSSRRRGPSST